MTTIKKSWLSFKKAVVPDGATETQIEETERAFYAGCFVMFAMVTKLPDNEDSAMERLSMLKAEQTAYLEDFNKRHNINQ